MIKELQKLIRWGNDIWYVEQPLTFMKLQFGCRATIIRLSDGKLFIHSPIKLDDQLKAEVDALGKVAYLISPNKLHHLYLSEWKEHYPDAFVYASPGLRKKRRDICWHADLSDEAEPYWRDEISQVVIKGSCCMEEVVFYHKSSNTLIVADLVENFDQNSSKGIRIVIKLVGMYGKPTVPPDWRLTFIYKRKLHDSLITLLSWPWDRVILAHGTLLTTAGREMLIQALKKIG